MDINKNQQTNTFVKGMNTDTSDMYLSSDQYRYAENVRPVTNKDNNSGELHLIEGTVLSEHTNKEILATNYIRDIAVYIMKDPDSSHVVDEGLETEHTEYIHGSWYVFKKVGDRQLQRVFGPCTELIWNVKEDRTTPDTIDDIKKSITTVVRYEAPLNIKLYIADSTGKHPIMVLNIANDYELDNDNENKFDDVFAYQRTLLPPAEVEIGSVSGSIISGKVQYVYRLYSKNGASTPLSILSKPLNLYKNEYSGYEAEKRSGRSVNISINIDVSENLNYILIYRISYLLSGELPKISLIKDEKITSSYIDIGTNIEENVGISEFLSMFTPFIYPKQIESKGDYLFAANMKYSQDDVDELFEYFDATSYSKGNYTEHYLQVVEVVNGNFIVRDIGEDTLLHHAFILEETPVYNPSHWNYYTLDETVTVDNGESDLTLDKITNCLENNNSILVLIANYSPNIYCYLKVYFTFSYLFNDEPVTVNRDRLFTLTPDSDILLFLKEIQNDVCTGTGYIEDSLVFDRICVTNNSISQPSFTITVLYNFCNGYGKNICWRYIYDDLPELSVQNQTGKSNKQNYKFTFRCGETYRFGVKLYNQYGQASSVKWIADIMIPDHANMYNNNGVTKFRNVGIEFFKTPGSNWNGITGWEIVRCERTLNDRKTITQGIIGFPLRELINEGDVLNYTTNMCNPGFMTKNVIYGLLTNIGFELTHKRYADSSDDIIMFSSPEYCYLQDDIEDILKSYKNLINLSEVYNYIPQEEINLFNGESEPAARSMQQYNSDMGFYFTIRKYDFVNHIEDDNTLYYAYNTLYNHFSDSGIYTPNTQFGARIYMNYFTPNYNTFNTNVDTPTTISEISFLDSPKSSDFAKQEIFVFKNNITAIDNFLFINWSVPYMLDLSNIEELIKAYMNNIDEGAWNDAYNRYPIGSGGKLILLKLNIKNITKKGLDSLHTPMVTVANIIKPTVPYGGYNKTAINNSTYISFGDYSGSNNINVFSGDTKNCIFTYNSAHNWYDSTYTHGIKMATVYAVPLESDIDILALYGVQYGVEGFFDYNILDTADAFDSYTQTKDSYLYNTVYNATPDIISWSSPEDLKTKIDYFDTRIHYSNPKINNESIDNWVQFQSANYIDVDSRYGEITDLKLFKDKLIFWLENATGLLAVNERVVLNDQNDTQVVLGTGGVLERYDYFTTVYGLKKNQHARTTSNDSLYWWDENNGEILLYLQKYDVTPLSTIKNIKNYINNNPVSSIPFLTYDNKYKEIIANVVNKGSIVYNEQIQAFSSVYTFSPIFETVVDSNLYLTDKNAIYKYNEYSSNTSKLFTENATPTIKYVVNELSMYNKTFDILTFGGRLYGGGFDDDRSIPYTGTETLSIGDRHARNNDSLKHLSFTYKTPLKQEARANGKDVITNTEYDFRLTIPRAGYETVTIENEGQPNESHTYKWNVNEYGDRMRGKTMQCELKSDSNDLDFSLQYITTKFRMSWT